MSTIASQKIVVSGLEETTEAATAAGDEFLNNGHQILHVINGGGSPITVTVDAPNPDNFGVTGASHDEAIVVTNAEERFIGPFDPKRFNDGDGKVQVTYSADTTVTVAVLEFGPAG